MDRFESWKKALLKMSHSMKVAANNISDANKYMLEKASKAKKEN